MKTLRLGTRKSALAQAQAGWVAGQLRAAYPDLEIETVLMTTSGDKMSSVPAVSGVPFPGFDKKGLPPVGGGESNLKALFTKEIEEALLDDRIDMAVHSLKDMSAVLPKGLVIGAVPEREDPRDVWISKSNLSFHQIPKNAKIGTGAVRRQAQLKRLLPDAELVPIRGNVDTRLGKLVEGKLDGIVLALAGLKRLGRERAATEVLPIEVLLPAVGQGCLGIEIRGSDKTILGFMKELDHAASHAAALAERSFLKKLSGSCQTPIAGYASIESGELIIRGLVISLDGVQVVSAKGSGRPFDAEGIGERLAEKLLISGAKNIL